MTGVTYGVATVADVLATVLKYFWLMSCQGVTDRIAAVADVVATFIISGRCYAKVWQME